MSLTTSAVLAWWITCICVIHANTCTETFFSRNVHLENKSVTDTSVKVLTSVPLLQCARYCHNTSSCLSLAYNKNDEKCELFSRIHIDPEDTISEQANLMFQKHDDNKVCDIPTTIRKGRVLYIGGQVEGSKAEFVCDDFHIPTTEAGVCDTSGMWEGLDIPCQQTLVSPYFIPASGKIQTGSRLVVLATPSADTKFVFALANGERNLNFNMGVRFTLISYREMVRNTQINGNSGGAELSAPYWPFVVNQEFNLTICAEETKYRVYIDKVQMFTYAYRRPISEINYVLLGGDVTLRKIRFYD